MSALGFFAEQHYGRFLPQWVLFAIGVLAILHSAAQSIATGWVGRRMARQVAEALLTGFIAPLRSTDMAEYGVRVNLMRFDGRYLTKVLAVPLDERAIVRWQATPPLYQGTCGQAVRERALVLTDLTPYRGLPYEAILHEDDRQPRWGLTREQWERTRDLGSVVSIPIVRDGSVLGVLNMDSRAGLREWLPEQRREALLQRSQAVTESLGLLLSMW